MLVGLLIVPPVSYLVAISQREQVAQVRGRLIYVVTDVALIPLSSQSDADKAINQAKDGITKLGQQGTPSPDIDISDDDETHDEAGQPEQCDQPFLLSSDSSTKEDPSAVRPSKSARGTSVAEDVIERKGQYGRFAERWFSKKGWTTERRRTQGMSNDGVEKLETPNGQVLGQNDPQSKSPLVSTTLEGLENDDETQDLRIPNQALESDASGSLPVNVANKLLRTTRMLLASRSFFFSYELDITRRLGMNDNKISLMPLHKFADPLVSHLFISISIRLLYRLMIYPSTFGTNI